MAATVTPDANLVMGAFEDGCVYGYDVTAGRTVFKVKLVASPSEHSSASGRALRAIDTCRALVVQFCAWILYRHQAKGWWAAPAKPSPRLL